MRYIIENYILRLLRSSNSEDEQINNLTLYSTSNINTYAVRRWAITGDIKMVSQEIGHASVVMTEKYAKFNLRKLRDDFPSLRDRINLRLTPPSEDKYFTTLLKAI